MALDLAAVAPILAASANKYRKTLLEIPGIGVMDALKHMTPRAGVTGKETTGWMEGASELRPYNGENNELETLTFGERDIETFLGSCVELFDPNVMRNSVYATLIANSDKVQDADLNKAILFTIMKTVMGKLNTNLFSAVRNSAGSTTADLFNGFDTITEAEITAGNIAVAKKNYMEIAVIDNTNAVDIIKSVYEGSSDELQGIQSKLFVPKSVYNAYNKDYQTTVGSIPYNREYKKTFVEGSDDMCELVPLIAKKGSNKLQLTTKGNMLYGYGNGVDKEKIEVRRGDNAFKLQFILAMFFGVEYQYIGPERLMVAKMIP